MTDHRKNLIETLATVAETFMTNGMEEYESIAVADGVLKVETYTATGDVEHTYTVDLSDLPMTVDGKGLPARYDAERIELVYADDAHGETATQSIGDLLEAGTAVDPETEDELDIVAVHIHPAHKEV